MPPAEPTDLASVATVPAAGVPVAGACKRGRAQDMLRCLQLRVPRMWTMRAHIVQICKREAREESRPIRSRILAWHATRPPLTDINFVRPVMCCPRCTLNSLQFRSPWVGIGIGVGVQRVLVDRLCFSLGASKGVGSRCCCCDSYKY